MARYPASSYGRRRKRTRKRVYIIISAVLIIVVSYGIYRRITHRGSHPVTRTTLESAIDADVVSQTSVKDEAILLEPEPDLPEVVPEFVTEPNSKAAELISEAMAHLNAKPARIIEARDRLNETLPMYMSSQQSAFVKEKLSELADKWLFSRTIFPGDKLCESLKVKPGSQLRVIGKQFKVPYEILMEINGISRAEALQAGQVIKIINGPFHARVYRSTFTMDVYLQNTFVRSFPVGLGKPSRQTPAGIWLVKPDGKLIKPFWTDPNSGKTYQPDNPDYPLGSRWIGLEGIAGEAKDRTGFAIHGTKKPEEIGTLGSQGCIRLHNGDAILLYNLLVPRISRVEVVE